MDFMTIFTGWLTVFSVGFTFLPIVMVLEWRRRGTSDGFSSINLVLAITMLTCWLRYGFLTNNKGSMRIHSITFALISCYLVAYAYYQPKRKHLTYHLWTILAALVAIFTYTELLPADKKVDAMGGIAAGSQMLRLAGAIYEIMRIIRFKHTEYLPATMTFGMTVMVAQWLLYGLLIKDFYVTIAYAAGLLVNCTTIAMYVVYPPLTWRVPLLGTGPQTKTEKKD